ncbi:Crp/Fnr family transcriptional regulator [Crocinitomix algicola]|uniref:Crp/Fnr family transcriptional regulator n=1 Tax=Crocinitomix algicola TaxID=1740263 RepID=UPI0008724167|nr:Crp/Fnr family transcriptional regulator [Crocinitomix algicola]
MEELFHHIQRYISISREEFLEIEHYFDVIKLSKKDHLQQYKNSSEYLFFVVSGCLHMYFINEKGDNQTVQFAIENWWMNDPLSFYHSHKTEFYFQAIEGCTILGITKQNQEKLLAFNPKIERYFRTLYQIAYGAALYRIKYIYEASKAERYFHFVQYYPEFAQRIPQYLIASYLGLSPEYVSEIRSKKLS